MGQSKGKGAKGPNKYPEPRTQAQAEVLATTCKYLGRIFYEGDTICYRGGQWQCSQGNWVDAGQRC